MSSYKYSTLLCFLALIINSFVFITHGLAKNTVQDASLNKTILIFKSIPCLNNQEIIYGKEILKGLDYNASRIFRQFCFLPGITFSKSKLIWLALLKYKPTYEQVLLFEKWCELRNNDTDNALRALKVIASMNYEAGKAFSQYCNIPNLSADHALNIVPLLNRLDNSGNTAALSIFSLPDISAATAIDSLGILVNLTSEQALTTTAFTKIKNMDRLTLLRALPLIRQFSKDNAWNSYIFFQSKELTTTDAWSWLTSYFANPSSVQNKLFYQLNPIQKKNLLNSYHRAGTEIIWWINNLHSVTDRFGIEISINTLKNNDLKQLSYFFYKLTPLVKAKFEKSFLLLMKKGDKDNIVRLLHQATAAARISTGKNLTSANIYALLAQGSELYDSSFRNILVPILQKRIKHRHSNNLLTFLKEIDPDNLLVSDFIVSLAQKGKLTTFFPKEFREQREILNLVAQSAFRDENSIILFSATFSELLKLLEPRSRSFLIEQFIKSEKEEKVLFAKMIRVILQYYLEEFPDLLTAKDQKKIENLLQNHTRINLNIFQSTPFQEWKADNNLRSISIFHPDDDGYRSFLSFARLLLRNKYRLSFSQRFVSYTISKKEKKYINKLIKENNSLLEKKLPAIFKFLASNQGTISLKKTVNNTTISHDLSIYSNEKVQANLFKQFILSGDEMFAQRGHSYWRSEQLIEPLKDLLASQKEISANLLNKQRFLSLGSCGGVKSYTRLHKLFQGKVDMLATIGTGLASINNPYNKNLFEIVAHANETTSWNDVKKSVSQIFNNGRGKDYIQPGSLPAILHKIITKF